MSTERTKPEVPRYGSMDREVIWAEATEVLRVHFTERGYDVHQNDAVGTLTVLDREPGSTEGRSGVRLTEVAHTTFGYRETS